MVHRSSCSSGRGAVEIDRCELLGAALSMSIVGATGPRTRSRDLGELARQPVVDALRVGGKERRGGSGRSSRSLVLAQSGRLAAPSA